MCSRRRQPTSTINGRRRLPRRLRRAVVPSMLRSSPPPRLARRRLRHARCSEPTAAPRFACAPRDYWPQSSRRYDFSDQSTGGFCGVVSREIPAPSPAAMATSPSRPRAARLLRSRTRTLGSSRLCASTAAASCATRLHGRRASPRRARYQRRSCRQCFPCLATWTSRYPI